MFTRRDFVTALSSIPLARFFGVGALSANTVRKALPAATDPEDFAKFVKVAIGTGGHGHTYPGATVPFGMVQLSPDTWTGGWDHCSGYHHDDTSIMGFSHTHLSGTGAADLLDVL